MPPENQNLELNAQGLAPRNTPRRLRVLISAYACEPNKGSEPGVGWNVATEMAKLHDVWVLTRANNREVIEAELAKHPIPGLNFIYYDLPLWAMWWKKGGRGVQLYYYLWEVFSSQVVRDAEKDIGFDIAHHVTIVRYWTPSNLRNVSVPLVWGPVGGGESTPANLKKSFSVKNRGVESVRDGVRRLAEFDPLVSKTAQKSSVALATTAETAGRLEDLNVKRVQVLSQLGMCSVGDSLSEPVFKNKRVRFICIGKQVYWKGFDLAVKAFAATKLDDAELILVGEGPEHDALQQLVQAVGVQSIVRFDPWMDQKTLHELLKSCDVLVHPSFHDSGAFVCLEAMSMSKPVICLDLGGPAVQVAPDTGVKVVALNIEQVVSDLSLAMRRLAENPELRQQMGAAGRKRVKEHFLWSKKVEFLSTLYCEVISDCNEAHRAD